MTGSPVRFDRAEAAPAERPLTLLFACGASYVSGMEVVELSVMRGLAARGHRVHALVNGWNDGDFIGRLEAAGIPYTVAFLGKVTARRPDWMLDTLRHLPRARRDVRQLLRDLQPDLVVLCNRDPVLLLVGLLRSVPTVFHLHEPMAPTWVRRLSRRVDGFIAVSGFIRDRVVASGVATGRVRVVHNGVDRAAPAPAAGAPPVVGVCGQVGAWKGHDDLVAALAVVASRDLPFRLRIYGKGDDLYTAALRARIAGAGLAEQTEWMGFERDPDRMYAGIDVLAAPSRFEEPFGMTLIEAGVRGLPAVATRVGGMPEVVADGETGLLVPSEAPAALADALAALLADADRRRAMGRAARARVEAAFLTDHTVSRFERAVLDVVAAGE
jgi:glycosyltransferase involved in cell wall biosynthesis